MCLTYLNDMGGMASESMDRLAKQIWAWCLERQIYITAVFVPGILNTADFYSRSFYDDSQFMLKKDIFNILCRHFFMPDIDLFASRLNKQLDTFVSWYPEPGSFHCNAFHHVMEWVYTIYFSTFLLDWQNYQQDCPRKCGKSYFGISILEISVLVSFNT